MESVADIMSTREAATLLGVSRQRIQQLGRDGVIVPVGWGPDGRTWDAASVRRYAADEDARKPGRKPRIRATD